MRQRSNIPLAAVLFALAVFLPGMPARCQSPDAGQTTRVSARPAAGNVHEAAPPVRQQPEQKPVNTRHEITIPSGTLHYTATAGFMPYRNPDGVTEAHIFFIAYTLASDDPPSHRPLTFCYNGGPGSSSVWLHLGAIGPRKVVLEPDGTMPPPPFRLEDNPQTWLDQTDLVFIDPVGTGYSRPTEPRYGRDFWGVQGDIQSVADFIRMYLTRYDRWNSPLFLAGESYGTTRSAGLSSYLMQQGIALNGIILLSTVLNFETLAFEHGNDLPYILDLPTYTATAWYHKRLPSDLQNQPLAKIIPQIELWGITHYAQALDEGSTLSDPERQSVIDTLARYTGLPRLYLRNANLRVTASEFRKELLWSENRSVGRLDTRFIGIDDSGVAAVPDHDPSETGLRPPFTAMFNDYIRTELGYKTDERYYILGGGFQHWNWETGPFGGGYTNVAPSLRSALVENRYLRIFVGASYYDLATPFFGAEYTMDHLGLDPDLQRHIIIHHYLSGHMIYIDSASLVKLRHDVRTFIENATNGNRGLGLGVSGSWTVVRG
jgi:carboxypeptidase C (cathepsin A)